MSKVPENFAFCVLFFSDDLMVVLEIAGELPVKSIKNLMGITWWSRG